jgi:YD repeat-containing protein
MQIDELVKIGLAETEAKTYIALLELGSGTVTSITHRAGITRTLGYHSLDQLIEFDLVEQKKNSQPAEFHVKHPKHLVAYVEKQRQIWADRVVTTKMLLPKLTSSYTSLGQPFISNHLGTAEVLDLYRTLYTNYPSTLSLFNASTIEPHILKEFLGVKSSFSSKSHICCVFDTPENRSVLANAPDNITFRWISLPNVHIDVYKTAEMMLIDDTFYTIHTKNDELYCDTITHHATVQGMYTLLYTFISS